MDIKTNTTRKVRKVLEASISEINAVHENGSNTVMSKEAALMELESIREEMLGILEKNIDRMKARILQEDNEQDAMLPLEVIYPLNFAPSIFKGTKPTTLYFGDEEVVINKWNLVYSEILRRCAANAAAFDRLMYLRNKISGRKRTILSDSSESMRKPVKVADRLFAEADFDTEWLIKILTKYILDAVGYNYGGIAVAVVEGKRRR